MDELDQSALGLETIRLEERPSQSALEKICDADSLTLALGARSTTSVVKLGDFLVQLGLLNRDQLGIALQYQQGDPKKHLGEILVELGFLTREQVDLVLCQKLGIPFVDLAKFVIEPRVLKVLPEELVRKNAIVPLCYADGRLVIAMPDPLQRDVIERVRFFTQGGVVPVMG